ncbi:MAG: hypothetical protein J6R67_01950 [Treponema sp.]|nr:hypothetical protein [Treponema sp.]
METVDVYKSRVKDGQLTEGWEKDTVEIFSIDRKKDIYGYLKIQAVSSEAIVFDYHRFQSPEKKVVKSYSLKKNKTLDLDNDGQLDVKYTPLLPVRENFEGAMCLEFISNQEALYSTMYATVTDEALARNTRSLEEHKNSTFYGVNSNGSFIYISGTDGTSFNTRAAIGEFSTEGISHGDYIINSANGEFYSVVGEVPADDRTDDTSNLAKELSLKKSDEYVEVNDNIELQAFFTYMYRENQFADAENGPQALLRALPKELVGNDIDVNTCTAEDALDQLFSILTSGSIVEIIVEANGGTVSPEDQAYIEYVLFEYIEAIFPDSVYEEIVAAKGNPEKIQEIIDANWNNTEVDVAGVKKAYLDLIAMNRRCIEHYYPESPRAIVVVPDISSVYPLMSLNIAEIPDHLNDKLNNTSPAAESVVPTAFVRSSIPEDQLTSEYKAYLAKKQKIDDEFSKFYSMSLSSIKITDLKDGSKPAAEEPKPYWARKPKPEKAKDNDPKETEIPLDALHFELKLGITGSFESISGHMESGLAGAIYTSFDGNLREFHQEVPNLYKKEFFDDSTTFMIGPVPITLGFGGTFQLGLEAEFSTKVNYAIQFVGMYGGGAEFAVDYGLKKWWNPFSFYVDTSTKFRLINNTEYYAGPVTQDTGGGNSYGGQVIFKPAIELEPSVAIGPKYLYAGVGFPINVTFYGGLGIYNTQSTPENVWFMIKKEFIAAWDLYGRLGLGTTISVTPKVGVKIPIINKKIEKNWNAIDLLKAEVFMNKDHNFEGKIEHILQ